MISFVTPNDVHYEITQTARGYTIIENGVDLKIKRIPDAEKFIRRVFPLLEIDYYTYCYISTQRPYLMQTDSDLNRLDHLTSIFRLDSYDLMRSHFVKQLAAVKTNELRLSVLEQKALELRTRVKKIKAQKSKVDVDVDALKHDQKELDRKLEKLNKQLYDIVQLIATLTTLKRIESELDILRKKYKYKLAPKEMYKRLIAERKIVRENDRYKEALRTYEKTVSTTQSKIDELIIPTQSRKELKRELVAINNTIEQLEADLKELEEDKRTYNRQEKQVATIKQELEELEIDLNRVSLKDDYASELAQCMSSLKLQSLLNHEHLEEDQASCPVCFSDIDLDNIKSVVATAKKRLPKIKALVKAQELMKRLKKEKQRLADLSYDPNQLEQVGTNIDELGATRARVEHQIKTRIRYAELKEALESIEKPRKPKTKPEFDLDADQIDAQIELCSNILKHLEAKERLLENDSVLQTCRTVQAVEKELKHQIGRRKELDATIAKVRTRLAKVSTELEKASIASSELELVSKDLKGYEKEIAELKPSVEDKLVLETLVKAYSTKGLKTIVANEVCQLLETNLNFYRDTIFAEPFTFTVKTSESGLSILVDRNNGIVSDVRNLSGAESNSFRLLFFLSIIILIPDERRLSMVTLDEPCSHMDEVSRDLFLTKYLPVLQEIIPHIYVITPNQSDYIEGSSLLLVKKSKGKSTLHTSYPKL